MERDLPAGLLQVAFCRHILGLEVVKSHHGAYAGGGGGFDANVAGQWSANVQQTRHNQQNRHDPSVAGPVMPSGGQRITQAPGGGSNIDLSWGGPPPAQQPPRLPGSTPSSGGGGNYR